MPPSLRHQVAYQILYIRELFPVVHCPPATPPIRMNQPRIRQQDAEPSDHTTSPSASLTELNMYTQQHFQSPGQRHSASQGAALHRSRPNTSPGDNIPRSPFAFGVPYPHNNLHHPSWDHPSSQYFQTPMGENWYSHEAPTWDHQQQHQHHRQQQQQQQMGQQSLHHRFDSPQSSFPDHPSVKSQQRPRSNSAMYIPNHDGLPVNLSLGAVFTESRGIFVGNLSYNTQWKDLKDHLSVAGRVIRCEVPQGPNGKGKGYATVLFETPEEAQKACNIFNGHAYMGRQLRVRIDKFAPTTSTGESGGRVKPTKVVGGGF